MKTESFASRHIGISEKDIEVMLRKIGVDTLDELINKTIPAVGSPTSNDRIRIRQAHQ